jgi:Cd2+/Zn2+-exporting ATPase
LQDVKLEVPVLLPDSGECKHCRDRLQDMVGRLRGVQEAKLDAEGLRLEVRFDPALTSAADIEREARAIGLRLGSRFAHERLDVPGLECADCAPALEKMLSRKDGVLWAAVNFPAGVVDVEYDPERMDRESLGEEIEQLGYGAGARERVHRHTSTFYIPEMDCDEEITLIRRKLGSLPGVLSLEFNLVSQRLSVIHRTAPEQITRALREIRMTPQVQRLEERPAPGLWEARKPLLLTIVSGVLTLAGFLLALLGAAPLLTIPVYAGGMLAGGWLVARRGLLALRTLTLDMNVLMTLAVIGAAAIGDWLEGATVIFLFSVANLLESYTMNRARRSIRALMDLSPKTARVRRQGEELSVGVEEVQVGDHLSVRPGERIPLDGVVVEGSSAVDQAPITGESLPVEKARGDEVFGGTINGQGYLEVQVTRRSRDTAVARIIHSVEQAQSRKAAAQRFVDRFARYYTPAVVGAALLVAVLPPLLAGAAWGVWLYRALVLLVVACPCALVISTPVTIVSGLARATREGILFKGGAFLEAMGRLRAFAFDKTGTLTRGRPEVAAVLPLAGLGEREVLRLAAGLESRSEHHLAEAVLACARARGVEIPEPESFQAFPGKGAAATLGGKRYYIGNHRLFEEMGWCYPAVDARLDRLEKQGQTAVLLGDGGRVLGIIAIADQPRPEAREALAELKRLGVGNTLLLTGDNRSTARTIAARLGVREWRSELLPEDKVRAVRELVAVHGGAVMVGDGVNDAPALAAATVGVAMGAAGTDAALETADVALMSDDLGKLPVAVRLSRRVSALVRQNVLFALALKAVFIALTPLGLTTLWMAVMADMGASLVVIFNGMRALRSR